MMNESQKRYAYALIIMIFLGFNVPSLPLLLAVVISLAVSPVCRDAIKAYLHRNYRAAENVELNRNYLRSLFVVIPLYFFISFWTEYLLSIYNITIDRPDLTDISQAPMGFVFMMLTTPIIEEIVFRGLLLSAFHKRLDAREANNIQAFFFAVGHPNNPVATFLFGYLMGIVVLRTGRLRVSTIAHIAMNSVLLLFGFILDKLYTNPTDEDLLNIVGLPSIAIAFIAALVLSRTANLRHLFTRRDILPREAISPAPRGHFIRNSLVFFAIVFIVRLADSQLGLSDRMTKWTGIHFDRPVK